jgi:hypothetical protein
MAAPRQQLLTFATIPTFHFAVLFAAASTGRVSPEAGAEATADDTAITAA